MLLGLSTECHHHAFAHRGEGHGGHGMDLFAFMERASDHGVRGVHCAVQHLIREDDPFLDDVREEAADRELFLELGIPDVAGGELARGLRICERLGCRILRARFGFDRFSRPAAIAAELDTADRLIRPMLRAFENADVTLAIESGAGFRSQELVSLIEGLGSTHAGVCLDVANSLLVLEDPVDAAERLIPFTVSVVVRDYGVQRLPVGARFTGVPVGQGVVALPEIFHTIREQGTVDRVIIASTLDAAPGERKIAEREETAIRQAIVYSREVLLLGTPESAL